MSTTQHYRVARLLRRGDTHARHGLQLRGAALGRGEHGVAARGQRQPELRGRHGVRGEAGLEAEAVTVHQHHGEHQAAGRVTISRLQLSVISPKITKKLKWPTHRRQPGVA